MALAPIALFVFNRPDHTRKTLSALVSNPEFAESSLYVFCDGPRSDADVPSVAAVRAAIREFDLPNAHVVESSRNEGLAKSISDGVSRVCAEHGRVIVLEDDLLVSRHFLDYMNRSLDEYAGCGSVMQISGHSFPAPSFGASECSSFLPFITSWGWATWKRAWDAYDPEMSGYHEAVADRRARYEFDLRGAYPYSRMVRKLERAKRLDRSWGVRWYWSVYRARGMALYPHRTLVLHFGDDGSGTNFRGRRARMQAGQTDTGFDVENRVRGFPASASIDERFYSDIRKSLRRLQSPWARALRFFQR